MPLTHLDLFSGIGGFALAAEKAGFQTIGFCEIDKFCQKVLQKNFNGVPIYPDIKTLNFKYGVDLITGGFPCQPFSQAGSKRGKDDDRYLWPEFKRVISLSKPGWAIIENVGASIPMVLDDIITDLENEGYETKQFVLPACAANAPHRRDRLWIIANRNSFGSDQRISNWATKHLQKDKDRYLEKMQQEWLQFIPNSWQTNTAKHWQDYNTRAVRGAYGIPTQLDKDRIKALGNAIVPQVIFPILKFIASTYE